MIYKSKGSWPEYTKNSLLTSKKKDNPTEKRERNVNKIFYEKGYTNYQKTLKRCSTSVLTRKMLIKPQLNTYLTWLNLKTLILPCVGEYEKQMKLFFIVGGSVSWYLYFENTFCYYIYILKKVTHTLWPGIYSE